MRIERLLLKNIGPFVFASLDFYSDGDSTCPVVLVTGENGTGKSIVLDAIRGLFGKKYCRLERNIARRGTDHDAGSSKIYGLFFTENEKIPIESTDIYDDQIKSRRAPLEWTWPKSHEVDRSSGFLHVEAGRVRIEGASPAKDSSTEERKNGTLQYFSSVAQEMEKGGRCPNWVVDYWSSVPTGGTYKVDALRAPDHKSFLTGSLQGAKMAADVVQLMCHFDYLRDSRDPNEKDTGEKLYGILEKIVEKSLLEGGKLSHISRSNYRPLVVQNGVEVALENLSSGNAYLISNMVALLSKMYSVHILRKKPLEELCRTPGLLLIDEAENQLHPKWQKRFIPTVLEIFPNLQIIATTHSPFIVSSVSNAKLFVCKAKKNHCTISDETALYSNKPVDEILMSPLFEETQPFNEKISRLVKERKKAVEDGDVEAREKIEEELIAANPEYFNYFDMDKLIANLRAGDMDK